MVASSHVISTWLGFVLWVYANSAAPYSLVITHYSSNHITTTYTVYMHLITLCNSNPSANSSDR